MGDVGFFIMFLREVGRDCLVEECEVVKCDYNVFFWFFFMFWIFFQVFIFIFGGWVLNEGLNWDEYYDLDVFIFFLFIFVIVVLIQMMLMLYILILVVCNDVIFVNVVVGFMLLFFFIGIVIGVVIGYVLEGFVIGVLFGLIVWVIVYRSWIVIKYVEWYLMFGYLLLLEIYFYMVDFIK